MIMKRIAGTLAFAILGVATCSTTHAQQKSDDLVAAERSAEVSMMYVAERAKYSYGSNFWMQGGAGEVAFPLAHHFSLVANVTGDRSAGVGGGSSLSAVAFTAGPRYTFSLANHSQALQRSRLFVESLFGGVHGFDATFPGVTRPSGSWNAFAMQVGGGYEFAWKRGLLFRPIDVHYVQTHLPNGTDNRQNNLRVGAGIAFEYPSRF